ncbi:MAG: hypothetical protein OQL19_06655 [Gammaproteobacteria bacterium]|nr:hypothetical protein [Gammaproteobacteria bacterium]
MSQKHVSVDWGAAVNIAQTHFFQNIQSPVLHTTLAKIELEFILFHGDSVYLPLQLVNDYLEKELCQVDEVPVLNRLVYACYHCENLI